MDETYLARHPLPYLGVTRRSKATMRFVGRITTPVRLNTCATEEIPFAFELPRGYHGDTALVLPIHARDGGFWAPFPSRGGLTSREAFTAFLEGAPDEDLRHNIDPSVSNLLARTPLLASCRRYNLNSDPGSTAGPADLRTVIHRDETRAAVALQAFLDARVILADEHAYVRVRGPLAVHRWGNTYGMSFFQANHARNAETPLRMDEVGRHFEWYSTRPLTPRYEIDPSRVKPKLTWADEVAIPADLPSEEDHAWLVANEMPDLVNHLVERTLNAPMRGEFADAIARFKVDAVWGSIGDIAGPDALAVLTRARDLAGGVAQRVPTGGMAHLYHYLDGFLLPPLLDAPSVLELDEEDADALAHLLG